MPMPKFLFDCGNTCIKFALYDEANGLSDHQFLDYVALPTFIPQLFEAYPKPDNIKIASVTQKERLHLLVEILKENTDLEPVIATSQASALGVTNTYYEPKALGVDRWLALIAAWDLYHKSSLVIDLGTALTVDHLTAEGEFEGGMILPGIKSLRDALIKDTAIRDITDLPYTSELGHNTSLCISSGIHYAIVGSVLALYQTLPHIEAIILSGGRAEWLKSILTPVLPPNTQFYVHKHLVLEGLVRFEEA